MTIFSCSVQCKRVHPNKKNTLNLTIATKFNEVHVIRVRRSKLVSEEEVYLQNHKNDL